MKKVIIKENQRGFLFKNGKFEKLLGTGKYHIFSADKQIEVVSTEEQLSSASCDLDTLLSNPEVAKSVSVVEVADQQLALHFINGQFVHVLKPGKYAFWNTSKTHTFQMTDTSTPEVAADVPTYIFGKILPSFYTRVEVLEYQRGRLYFDRKLVRILEPGTYYFWKTDIRVDTALADTRLMQYDVSGQEILTADKVSLRINFVLTYRVTDFEKIVTEIDDYEQQMHVAVQLALREYVGKHKLDEILENKDEMSNFVFQQLKAKEKNFFVEITDGGVKDIILPGEIRQIMNSVLVAEKQAQANVITRREEVASTRSLLNTAKLMDENQTLYRLKELELIERICGNVGNINLSGNSDLLTQLTSLLQSKAS